MTKKVHNLSPWGGPRRAKGVVHEYYSPFYQRWIVRRWPKGQGADSPMRALARQTFTQVVKAIKSVTPEDRVASDELATNTPYLDRDLLYKAATGTLLQFTDDSGAFWMSTRIAIQAIQPMLDSISNMPGAVIFRNVSYWDALEPPVEGMVLIFDPDTMLPKWVTMDAAAKIILDGISTTEGAVLYRGATEWQALAPGDPGQALITGGAGNPATWGDVTPPSSLVDYGLSAMPLVGTTTFAQNFASMGNAIKPSVDITVSYLATSLTTITAGVYRMGIATFDTSTRKITGAPVYTASQTIAAGKALDRRVFKFAVEQALTAGQQYLVWITRTDATSTTSMTIGGNGVQAEGVGIFWPNGSAYELASLAPATTDTWANVATVNWAVGIVYRLT